MSRNIADTQFCDFEEILSGSGRSQSESPFRERDDSWAFQNGSARTRTDADASTHKKGAGRHADASDEANEDQMQKIAMGGL